MTTKNEWQGRVGQNWARSHALTDRAFRGITAHLLDAIASLPGNEIIDIGCGAGELSLALAAARTGARVTGVDVSDDLVEAARRRAAEQPRCAFVIADAGAWQPDRAPDLLVSRHGVMFFPDPQQSFAHLRAIAAPGSALVFSCFRALADNPWATEPPAALGLAGEPSSGYVPGPFALRDEGFTRELLARAGWRDIRLQRADAEFVVGEGPDALGQAVDFVTRIGPAAAAFAAMDHAGQESGRAALRARLAEFGTAGLVAPQASIWIVTARV
jgi:SAM-dependent methyltransferase